MVSANVYQQQILVQQKALADDDECLCFSMKTFRCCFCVGKVNLFANNG